MTRLSYSEDLALSKILIVRLSAIGDVLQTTPVARQLKQHYPNCHLTWLVDRKALPGIAHNPHLDEVLVLDSGSLRSWLQTLRRVRNRFDLVIDTQCRLKTALLTRATGAPVRLGKDDARPGTRRCYTELVPFRMDQDYVSVQYLEQCASLGLDPTDYRPELHLSPEDHEAAARTWTELGLEGGAPVVGLIAFSAEPTREWPTERFGQVGDGLATRMGARLVVFGSPDEVPRAEALAEGMEATPLILAGKTSLGQAAAMLQRCDLVLGADTGLIHYAFALGTPTVCLIGPSPMRNGPKGSTALTVAAPCPFRPCRPSDKCQRGQGRPCLEEITVAQVVDAATQLLSDSR